MQLVILLVRKGLIQLSREVHKRYFTFCLCFSEEEEQL